MFTHKTLTTVAVLVLLATATYVALPYLNHWSLTGRFFPVNIVEKLNSPISVKGWSEEGLFLADGRTVPLPGFLKLPKTSQALSEATRRGVEIASDGRVFGLVRVHHWCGNDPVGRHIARIDLAHLLIVSREGELAAPLNDDARQFLPRRRPESFTEWGWNVSDYGEFKGWSDYYASMATEPRDAPVQATEGAQPP